MALAFVVPSAHATLTDGTYTGTVNGQYNVSGCVFPGVFTPGIVPFSGATATLDVQNNGAIVTLSILKSGVFTATGVGFESGGNLDLNFNAANGAPRNLNITVQLTGDSISGGASFTSVTESGGIISIGSDMIGVFTINSCTVNFDWSPFTVTSTVTSGGGGAFDPKITPTTRFTKPKLTEIQSEKITVKIARRIGDLLLQWRGIRSSGDTPQPIGGPKTSARATPTDSGFVLDATTGLNAGDGSVLYGAWGSYTYSDFENEFASTAYDGDGHLVLAGIDVSPWENTLFGIAIGYESSDIDSTFNAGNEETDGFTIAPYFGALLTDTWSIDFSFGYSNLDTDQFRTAPGTTTIITSSPDSDRWFGALGLNGVTTYKNWVVVGRLGLLYAQDEQDAYVESDGTARAEFKSEINQWNIGGDVAYSYGAFEPFARATYEKNFKQTDITIIGGPQPSFDDDDIMFGAGVRYFGSNGISANFEWNKRLDREDFDEDTYTFTIRSEF